MLQSDFENLYVLHSLNRSGIVCKTSRQLQHDLADSREKQYVQQYRLQQSLSYLWYVIPSRWSLMATGFGRQVKSFYYQTRHCEVWHLMYNGNLIILYLVQVLEFKWSNCTKAHRPMDIYMKEKFNIPTIQYPLTNNLDLPDSSSSEDSCKTVSI